MSPVPKKTDPKPERDFGSPYGPQPDGDDEAAGGADSSPHETKSSGELLTDDEGKGLPGSKANDPGDAGG
jgi:hypothetical protein